MNWEVKTMRSKTSLFNKSLYLQDIRKLVSSLLVLLLGFTVVIVIPYIVMNRMPEEMGALFALKWVLTNPVLIGGLSITAAVVVFSYIYKKRSSYMLHAMPAKRLTHFVSHYLSGLSFLIVLAALSYLLVLITNGDGRLTALIWICFGETLVEILFFYSLAVFTSVVCGNVALSYITFIVLNALWIFINALFSLIHYILTWHPILYSRGQTFGFITFEGLKPLCPSLYFFENAGIGNDVYHPQISGLINCAWMLIPAAALILLAALLYVRRKLEHTGEIVAFPWCRIVFRILFTFCGAGLVAGAVYMPLIATSVDFPGAFGILIVLIVVGGAVSFLISEMILGKNIHIFRGKRIPLWQGIIPIAGLILYVSVLGFQTNVANLFPDAANTVSIRVELNTVYGTEYYDVEDKDRIEELLNVYAPLADDKEVKDRALRVRNSGEYDERSGSLALVMQEKRSDYCFTDAATFFFDEKLKDKILTPFLSMLNDKNNTTKFLFGSDADRISPISAFCSGEDVLLTNEKGKKVALVRYDYIQDTSSTEEDAVTDSEFQLRVNMFTLYQAILKDLQNGNIVPYGRNTAEEIQDSRKDTVLTEFRLEFSEKVNLSPSNIVSIAITSNSTYTLDFLRQNGISFIQK